MEKLIEVNHKYLVVCDNPKCDFEIPNVIGEPNVSIEKYLDRHCPKCDNPLFTHENYEYIHQILDVINWINKYFSWCCIFIPKCWKPINCTIRIEHNNTSIEIKNEK